jgi:hypothetical protein
MIEYEPEVVTDGPRFDFAVDVEPHLYVEVKTVEPKTEDNDRNWSKVVQRQEHVSPGTHYIVAKEWMGATLFGNSFSARSSFMAYTLETEAKLDAHAKVTPGRCVLVFCGTGFIWHVSELEDFSDFYSHGRHRMDDPFANMEQHSMQERDIKLARTLEGFAALHRHHDAIEPAKWVYPVRGPTYGCP